MSDEEDESISEGFSASEDEWKPGKSGKHDDGESSDDDDSDFEESIIAGAGSTKSQGASRKRETKSQPKGTGGGVAKKRKPMGQSLRSRLYNKYRPPPKTVHSLNSASGGDSPRASTSHTASKNARTPNEVSGYGDEDEDGSSSDSSVGNHLVNPAELDLRSSFFNIDGKGDDDKATPAPPVFDCNAGIANLSDSDSEGLQEASGDEEKPSKAFDFRNLLEKANSLERMKEQIAKNSKKSTAKSSSKAKDAAMDDVTTLLALGENQHLKSKKTNQDLGTDEDDEDDDADEDARAPSKLNKTKSTRIKKHKKTRPSSTVVTTGGAAGGESDDSDWEEVAGDSQEKREATLNEDGLEIFVEPATRKRSKEAKTQDELEMAFRRRLNRDLKDQQLLLHKTSLLCLFGRSYHYNRLLNDTNLMQAVLKILPGAKAYPRETGTELKYFQSFVTWFKTVIKLTSPNFYPENSKVGKTNSEVRDELIAQIKHKEARCKQDMVFIFITLLRGMGLQCRLIVNMQPLPLKPSQKDLLPIKLKPDNKKDNEKEKKATVTMKKESDTSHGIKKSQTTDDKGHKNDKTKNSKETEKKHTKSDKQEVQNESKDIGKQKEPKSKDTRHGTRDRNVKKAEQKHEKVSTENDNEEKPKETKVKKKPNGSSLSQMLQRNVSIIKEQDKNTKKEHEGSKNSDKNLVKLAENTKPNEKLNKGQSEKEKSEPKKTSRKKIDLSRLKRVCTEISREVSEAKKAKSDEHITTLNNSTSLPKLKATKESAASNVTSGLTASDSGINLDVSTKQSSDTTEVIHVIPSIMIRNEKEQSSSNRRTSKANSNVCPTLNCETRSRSRSISPRPLISAEFLQSMAYKEKLSPNTKDVQKAKEQITKAKQKTAKPKISTDFLQKSEQTTGRILRSRQNIASNAADTQAVEKNKLNIPQLDGADDDIEHTKSKKKKKQPQPQKLHKSLSKSEDSDEDFHPSPPKQPKRAPVLPKAVTQLRKDRRVLSTDTDSDDESKSPSKSKKGIAADIWAEVWSDVENEWICVDLFKGKLNSVESIRKSASSNMAYIFAFQNDLSLKDVTARYCQNWSSVIRKDRVPKVWLETAITPYYGIRTERDIREDHELRRIHEEKEMPKSIAEFKDHPLYALERHLLKFQALYPPNAPTFGFTSRGDPIYSRDCVHTLHSREIWLKQARTVKLGEKPYKIVKARPKWDRLTQSVIKDMPLEIFGFWQTEDYEPPTAENGIVPRNAYGNVELFKECMLPKKTVHIRLPGLNRICKKLGVDCANAVIGFDFHQGACHPTFDGFVVCEEFGDQVTAAWYQDQEEQDRKEQEKYLTRVYGNWKKLIRGLVIRERLKKKYNF